MARKSSFLAHMSQYLSVRAISGLLHSFSIEENLATAASIGRAIYRINHGRRERAFENVRLSFPGIDEARVAEIVERSYEHMIQLFLVDAIAAPRLMTTDGWPRQLHVGDVAITIDLFVRRQPALLITGHIGNWELLASFLSVLGFPVYALARPLDNPYLNRWLIQMREARGARIITKWGAIPIVQHVLREGGQIALIADQNAGNRGLFVPYLGRFASSYKSIALLAIRYEVPVVAGYAKRIPGRFEYQVNVTDVIRPDDWADVDDPVFYITARYNRAIETMVRESPEQYLWVHRRWKSRPRFEVEGERVPARLIAKLESLPWMTTDDLQRLLAPYRH